MQNEEMSSCIHDLANMLMTVDINLDEAHSLCQQKDVLLKLERAINKSKLALELLQKMKLLAIDN